MGHELKPYMLHGAKCSRCGKTWERIPDVSGNCVIQESFSVFVTEQSPVWVDNRWRPSSPVIWVGDKLSKMKNDVSEFEKRLNRIIAYAEVLEVIEENTTLLYEQGGICSLCKQTILPYQVDALLYYRYEYSNKCLSWIFVDRECLLFHRLPHLFLSIKSWFSTPLVYKSIECLS